MAAIKGIFETRREAEMAVEHFVQQMGIERNTIFIEPEGGDNSAGTEIAGAVGGPAALVLVPLFIIPARTVGDASPSTIAASVRPLRVAVPIRLKPDGQMKPVFMPSTPGYLPISVLKVLIVVLPTTIPSIEK